MLSLFVEQEFSILHSVLSVLSGAWCHSKGLPSGSIYCCSGDCSEDQFCGVQILKLLKVCLHVSIECIYKHVHEYVFAHTCINMCHHICVWLTSLNHAMDILKGINQTSLSEPLPTPPTPSFLFVLIFAVICFGLERSKLLFVKKSIIV